MCGKYGIVDRVGNGITVPMVESLHYEAVSQGRGAWGFMTNASDHFDFKKAPGFQIDVRPEDVAGKTILLGHTRAATSGSTLNNDNNHPVISEDGNVLTNHNGGVDDWGMYKMLEKSTGVKIKPYCQVDTLAISEVFAHLIRRGRNLMEASISAMHMMEGFNRNWLAIATVVNSIPNQFVLCRLGAPLTIRIMKGYIMYATRHYWMNTAIDEMIDESGMSPKLFEKEFEYTMEDGDIIHFDNNARTMKLVNPLVRNKNGLYRTY